MQGEKKAKGNYLQDMTCHDPKSQGDKSFRDPIDQIWHGKRKPMGKRRTWGPKFWRIDVRPHGMTATKFCTIELDEGKLLR